MGERFTIVIDVVQQARRYLAEVEALAREGRISADRRVLIDALDILATVSPRTLGELRRRLEGEPS